MPQQHLLSALASAFGGGDGRFAAEAERLEAACLRGRFVVDSTLGARYRFQPDGGPPLGLQVSSALVTELMPLIVALRHAKQIPFLFIEEPEAGPADDGADPSPRHLSPAHRRMQSAPTTRAHELKAVTK